MALIQEFNNSGNFLFRNRSFIPIILYPLATLVILVEKVPVLYNPDIVWSVVCLLISVSGLAMRTIVVGWVPKGTSGRNRKKQVANTLNTNGIYSTVRHPLYLGNFLMWMGLIIYTGNIWFIIIAGLLFWVYYERIMFAEEDYLRQKFGDDFETWARQTPAFFPKFKKWKKPDLTFSVKKSIRREYRGLFAVIVSFVYLNLLKNLTVNKNFTISNHWIIFLVAGLIFFTTVHILNKKTHLLNPKSDRARSQTD